MAPPDFASIARELSALLARNEFEAVVRRCSTSRLTPEELHQAILEYPFELVPPPPEAAALIDVVEVTVAKVPTWSVNAPLWEADGRSDLTLQLEISVQGGSVRVALEDVHVL